MKALKTKIIATSLAAFTCASFSIIQSRDEELRCVSHKQVIVIDSSFSNFLKNLKSINAIIFIPDSKVASGKELNLQPVQPKNDSVNLVQNYIRVEPLVINGDNSSSKNKLSFDNLKMVVFIEKQYEPKLAGLKICYAKKQSGEVSKIYNDFFKIGSKYSLIIDGSTTLLTQVEFKL